MDNQYNIIKALIILNVSLKDAKVLALLISLKSVPTRDFERMLDMRQPEVSLSLKHLQSRGWVRNGDKVKSDNMSRTGKTYEMAYTLKEIIEELQKQEKSKQEELSIVLLALQGL